MLGLAQPGLREAPPCGTKAGVDPERRFTYRPKEQALAATNGQGRAVGNVSLQSLMVMLDTHLFLTSVSRLMYEGLGE